MSKITKIAFLLAGLLSFTAAQAGELAVTGSMQATYQNEAEGNTGNPLGMDRELKFAGSVDTDFGTVSVMQDTSDALAFGNGQISFGLGFGEVYVGSDHDPMDAVDDITPTAFEEANGAGAGTFIDVNGAAGSMGIGFKKDLGGAKINLKGYPRADNVKNADKTASTSTGADAGSAGVATITSPAINGMTVMAGYYAKEYQGTGGTDDGDMTLALNYAAGPLKIGLQAHRIEVGGAAASFSTDYDNEILGIAYAVSDELSLSINRFQSDKKNTSGTSVKQSADALNASYTVGGLTFGAQVSKVDDAGYVANAKDETRTVSVKAAF